MLDNQETYTIQELFELLPVSISELARQSKINEVTLARMRDGERTRRDTANKLLMTFSQIYGKTLNIRNVTGLNIMRNKRMEDREEKRQQKSQNSHVA